MPRFSIRRLMVVVAVVAGFLPAMRGTIEGERISGVLIVWSCLSILAWKLAEASIARRRSAGLAVSGRVKIRLALVSLVKALIILGSANFCFFFAWAFFFPTRFNHDFVPLPMLQGLLTIGMVTLIRLALKPDRMSTNPARIAAEQGDGGESNQTPSGHPAW